MRPQPIERAPVAASSRSLSGSAVEQLLEGALSPDAGHLAFVARGAAQVVERVHLVADEGCGLFDQLGCQTLTA